MTLFTLFRKLILTTVVFGALLLTAMAINLPTQSALLDTARVTHATGFSCQARAELAGLDGQADLRAAPGSDTIVATLRVGTPLCLLERTAYDGIVWYRVSTMDGRITGWAPSMMLQQPRAPIPSFSNFRFCEGTVARPSTRCGADLSLDATGLWVSWNYAGIQRDDLVQWVLVVNDERYAAQPVSWNFASSGRTLINVLTLNPRLEPGMWSVWIIVNGHFAGVSTVRID